MSFRCAVLLFSPAQVGKEVLRSAIASARGRLLIWNNTGSSFAVSPNGTVTVARTLELSDYLITIVAVEEDAESIIAVVAITVDRDPVFEPTHYDVSVPENLTLQSVVINVTVVYTGPSSVSYKILSGNNDNVFAFDGDSNIVLISELNFERRTMYQLTVGATSSTNRTSTASVTIRVSDVNEPPSFTSSSLQFNITGTTSPDTVFGYVLATDADAADKDKLVYNCDSVSKYLVLTGWFQ